MAPQGRLDGKTAIITGGAQGIGRAYCLRFASEGAAVAVVGLREGAMLRIEGSNVILRGTRGARIFRRGRDPEEVEPGARLDALLAG